MLLVPETAAGALKVLLLLFCVSVLSFAFGCILFVYFVVWSRFVTSLLFGAHDPSFHCCLYNLFLCLLARFVEKAVFGCGVLVGTTSQHFSCLLGREHIFRELRNT